MLTAEMQKTESGVVSGSRMGDPQPMTVAMLLSCDSFEAFFGGVIGLNREKYLSSYRNDWAWYYAAGLKENGIQPVLYLPSLKEKELYRTDAGISVRFLPLAAWFRLLSPLRRAVRITRWTLYLYERLNAAALTEPLRKAMAADHAALLYIQEYWSGRFDHVMDCVDVPVVAADHGAVADRALRWWKGKTLEKAAVLYCQTRKECALVESYGGRAVLHPNGVDTTYFTPGRDMLPRRKSIATVARLNDKHKHTSDLIRAMRHLPQDWVLDIVGTGPDRKMLESLADQLGVASRVKFHGFKGKPEVRSVLQRCGVYAMPSGHEAICLAVLEAMACGAAVVASHIDAFESMITDGVNGKLFPVRDVAALAQAIEEAWHARDALGAAAVLTVTQEFNSATLYRQLAQSLRASANLHACDHP